MAHAGHVPMLVRVASKSAQQANFKGKYHVKGFGAAVGNDIIIFKNTMYDGGR